MSKSYKDGMYGDTREQELDKAANHVYQYLLENQVDLEMDEKAALYKNLWELYE